MLGLPLGNPKSPPLPGRRIALAIALFSFSFQLWLTSILSGLASTVTSQLADEDGEGEWRRLEALKAVILLGRFWALMGAFVSLGGAAGVVKDHAPLVRLFCLQSFLSLAGELLLLAFGASLAFTSSSSTFVSTLCETISNSDVASSFLGSSIESCEERWNGLATALTGFIAATSLVRLYCSVNILSYYTMLSKRSSRRKPLNVITRLPSYRDVEASASPGGSKRSAGSGGGGGGGGGHKIFLLPNPVEQSALGAGHSDVPLLAMTPPSPSTSFPPKPAQTKATSSPEEQFLVYAPVMMTAEQAGQLGATEVVYSRPRSRSHPHQSPLNTTPTTSLLLHDPQLEATPEEDGNGKGKLA